MNSSTEKTIEVPPDVARYLRGATVESRQFDFLIGDWDVAASRYQPDGALLLQYQGLWSAQHLNDGRMIMDDFKTLAPTGEAVSSYVTLRTYSESTRRWEMTGLAALQPAAVAQWWGEWKDGEMHTEAIGETPAGTQIRNRIRFFSIESNRFAWESNVSLDDGNTWARATSLTATRSKP
jgi:hypothetical protein